MAYREGGSVTHENRLYDLDCLLALVDNRDIIEFSVDSLIWLLDAMPSAYFDDPIEKSRVIKADLLTPIIVTSSSRYGRLVVLDGIHRLRKAYNLGQRTLKGKLILESELEKCVI